MIIKDIECEQFAGLKATTLNQGFSDGLNILLGANEAGKSTMVDLMYHLLFQEVVVRKNSEFQKIYFPKKADGISGDYVGGKITFATDSGEYVLEKSWEGSSGRCKLTLPNGTSIVNSDKINEIILQELVYGKGIYDEVVFASQKRVMTLLQGLFISSEQKLSEKDKKQVEVKQELSAVVTKAVMETGGINIEKVERKLKEKLAQYNEKWDFEADAPADGVQKRGIHNKWDCAKHGEDRAIILRAYYDMEEIADMQRKARAAEDEVDNVNIRLRNAQDKRKGVREKADKFQQFSGKLERRGNIIGRKADAETSCREMKNDIKMWAETEENHKKADDLHKRLKAAKCRDLYDNVKELKDSLEKKRNTLAEIGEVNDVDVKEAVRLERELAKLSGQLKGMNLIAKMNQLGDIVPQIRSLESGEALSAEDGKYNINEAVEITVSGIMELQLMPAGVDIDAVKGELAAAKEAYDLILQKYHVLTLEDLQEKQSVYTKTAGEVCQLEEKIDAQLGEADWNSIEAEYSLLPEKVDRVSEITSHINKLCKGDSLDTFLGKQNGIISHYEKKYGTKVDLTQAIHKKEKEIKEFQKLLDELDDIPEEFSELSDPVQYGENLKGEEEACSREIENLRSELSQKESALGERTAEEYSELLIEKKEEFAAKKEAYEHWNKIADVVKRVKAASAQNPMWDIEEKFREYLKLLSKGGIHLETFSDHMDSAIASGGNRLIYEILSEGTRDTIALALRLSILEHLYPEGGGLAVFDDPFTDMDPDRTAQACKLVQKFAEKNQVIFVTCDSKYIGMLDGSVIELVN